MRLKRTAFAVLAASMVMAVGACGDAGDDDEGTGSADVAEDAASEFEDGTAMKQWAEDGKITIGVKFDQPGIGEKGATDDVPSGFDIEIGKIIAGKLGIDGTDPEQVEWKETISDNREPFLQEGEVDLVIASYSITDERKQLVGQTGPYYVTGQQLLVQKGSDIQSVDDIKGKEVCSVTGSTSLDNVEAEGAKPRGFDTYSECVDQVLNGTVDSMTTDGAILLGYAAEHPDELEVVGEPFSEERYGIGFSKDSPEVCQFLNDTLEESFEDGSWDKAFESTLGKSGVDTPEPPELDDCQS